MSRALVCETVTGATTAELRRARDAATQADMVELRLDGVADPDVLGALADRTRPVVVTCRPTWEGGRFDGPEEARRMLLAQALDAGADYVDIEWRAGFDDLIRPHASRVVLSSHDFGGVPEDLTGRAAAMRRTGAGTIKIAVAVTRLCDTLPLRAIAEPGDAVVIGMGEAGVPSRLLSGRFGSRWSYAGQAVAPGQMPAARMIDEFRFREIGAETALYGIVGGHALASLSPCMHNAAFRAAGIDAAYVPLRPADFDDFLEFARTFGFRGASVTIPYKLDALQAAGVGADSIARQVGAANTLRRTSVGWEATNTDVDGFLAPLVAEYPGPLRGVRAAVLGAGGAARAVVAGLAAQGARVTVHARRPDQAALVAGVEAKAGSWPTPPGSWDLLVNCTPLGGPGHRDASPLPDGPFDGHVVYDLTYGDVEAPLLRAARAAGCRTLDGLPMLIAQAERQSEWWTGQRPPAGVMRAAALRRMERA